MSGMDIIGYVLMAEAAYAFLHDDPMWTALVGCSLGLLVGSALLAVLYRRYLAK